MTCTKFTLMARLCLLQAGALTSCLHGRVQQHRLNTCVSPKTALYERYGAEKWNGGTRASKGRPSFDLPLLPSNELVRCCCASLRGTGKGHSNGNTQINKHRSHKRPLDDHICQSSRGEVPRWKKKTCVPTCRHRSGLRAQQKSVAAEPLPIRACAPQAEAA